MNGEYILAVEKITLEAVAATPANIVSVPMNITGSLYHHMTAWAYTGKAGVLDIDTQGKYMGVDDGAAGNIITAGMTNVFQMTANEIRPPSRLIQQYNNEKVPAPTWALEFTNNDASAVTIHVYICVAAAVGGS